MSLYTSFNLVSCNFLSYLNWSFMDPSLSPTSLTDLFEFFTGKFRNAMIPFWEKSKCRREREIPLAPMGVLAPGSAHARPSAQPPINTSGNSSAHMSGGGNCLTVFLINFLAKSENSKHFYWSLSLLYILLNSRYYTIPPPQP